MPVIFTYSLPSTAAFVFERDRLLGSCSLAPWPRATASPPAGVPPPPGRLPMQAGPGPSRGPGSRARLGGFMFKTRVLWKFPPACISVPRLLQFQGWCSPSRAPLGSIEHLEAPASQQCHSPFVMGEVVVWEQVFSFPRSH